jgi:hypothetical protein
VTCIHGATGIKGPLTLAVWFAAESFFEAMPESYRATSLGVKRVAVWVVIGLLWGSLILEVVRAYNPSSRSQWWCAKALIYKGSVIPQAGT